MIINEDATIKEERTTPYILGIGFSISGLILSFIFKLNPVTTSLWFCYISNVAILIVINRYWKISAHAIGVSGPVGVLCFVFGWIGLIGLALMVLVGWARLKLKVHTPAQVICGSIFGFGLTYLQLVLLQKIF
ncbi:MAG: phosphatase PAP2 family protein [bacterium]